MRIVAGTLRGRALVAPKGHSTRPTADRVRQALFDVLEHAAFSPGLAGVRVLDLFAGSGALGLEALSRGAASCLFIDSDPAAAQAISLNIRALKLEGRTQISLDDAARLKPFSRPSIPTVIPASGPPSRGPESRDPADLASGAGRGERQGLGTGGAKSPGSRIAALKRCVRDDGEGGDAILEATPFDLTFLDPPYGLGLAERALRSLRQGGWLAEGAVAVVERGASEPAFDPAGFEPQDVRAWGPARVHFFRTF